MAGDTTIRAIIKLLVEGGHIPKEVAESIKGVSTQAKKTEKDLGALGHAGQDLGKMLRDALGAAAIGAFAKESVGEFATVERATNALGFVLHQLGLGGAEDAKNVREQLEGLALSGGAKLAQSLPSYQRFIGITHDMGAAMAATKLASDVSKTGVVDFGTATGGVVALLQGRAKLAANLFGIQLRETGDATRDNAELMRLLVTQVSGVGDAFADSQSQLDRAAAEWDRIKETVGEGLAPSLKLIPDLLFHIMGTLKDLGVVAGFVFNSMIGGATAFSKVGVAAFDFTKLLADPKAYWSDLKKASADAASLVADAWKTAGDQIVEDHTRVEKKLGDQTKGQKTLEQQAALASAKQQEQIATAAANKKFDTAIEAERKSIEAQISIAKEGSIERRDLEAQLTDIEERDQVEKARRAGTDVEAVREQFRTVRAAKARADAETSAAFQRNADRELLQSEIEGAAQGSERKFALEMDALHDEYVEKMRLARQAGEDTEAITLKYEQDTSNKTINFVMDRVRKEADIENALAESRLGIRVAELDQEQEYSVQQSDAWIAAAKARIDAQHNYEIESLDREIAIERELVANGDTDAIDELRAMENKKLAIQMAHANATKALERSHTQYVAQQYAQSANAMIQALNMVFGKNKTFALAMLAINTASAVMNAWAHATSWEEGLVETIAIGLLAEAQRQQISSASFSGSAGADVSGFFATAGTGPSSGTGPGTGGGSEQHNADGAIAGQSTPKIKPHPGGPRGLDTIAAWLSPGEIVAPASDSAEVLAGRAVIAAPIPGAKGKRIVGGRLLLVPTGRLKPGTPRITFATHGAIAGMREADTPVDHRSAGGGPDAPRGRHETGVRAFKGRLRMFGHSQNPTAHSDRPRVPGARIGHWQTGGNPFSHVLLPDLGAAAMGSAASSAMRPSTGEQIGKAIAQLSVIVARPQTSAQDAPPTLVDQSTHIHGPIYGGDAGLRQLGRELDSAKRRDQNRILK